MAKFLFHGMDPAASQTQNVSVSGFSCVNCENTLAHAVLAVCAFLFVFEGAAIGAFAFASIIMSIITSIIMIAIIITAIIILARSMALRKQTCFDF